MLFIDTSAATSTKRVIEKKIKHRNCSSTGKYTTYGFAQMSAASLADDPFLYLNNNSFVQIREINCEIP